MSVRDPNSRRKIEIQERIQELQDELDSLDDDDDDDCEDDEEEFTVTRIITVTQEFNITLEGEDLHVFRDEYDEDIEQWAYDNLDGFFPDYEDEDITIEW